MLCCLFFLGWAMLVIVLFCLFLVLMFEVVPIGAGQSGVFSPAASAGGVFLV